MEFKKNIRKIINECLNEGNIEDFKYDKVKDSIQSSINNGALTLDDISPNRYFIVCFDMWGKNLASVSTLSKSEANEILNNYKNEENIWKIYVEKPTIGAIVYLRKEWGWEKK